MADRFTFRAVPITVITFNLATAESEGEERVYQYHDKQDRARFSKHLFWCLCNGRGVQVFAQGAELHPDIAEAMGRKS